MLASVDDNNDGELSAPEFADFQRIVRARAIDTSKKALKVVDTDSSGINFMLEIIHNRVNKTTRVFNLIIHNYVTF